MFWKINRFFCFCFWTSVRKEHLMEIFAEGFYHCWRRCCCFFVTERILWMLYSFHCAAMPWCFLQALTTPFLQLYFGRSSLSKQRGLLFHQWDDTWQRKQSKQRFGPSNQIPENTDGLKVWPDFMYFISDRIR